MIKLIATDMDGTLFAEGSQSVKPELLEVILKLKEKGAIFVVASGRQYPSMRSVFAPILNDLIFIADNGGYVTCRGREIERCALERELMLETIAYARTQSSRILLETVDQTYTDSTDPTFHDLLVKDYRVDLVRVEDLAVLDGDVQALKVALRCDNDAQKIAVPAAEHFRGRLHVMASGAYWVDFAPAGVDKGNALARIQELMHISPEETMAFGDNSNDIGMLNRARESYAVANAREEVKKAARYVADSSENDGVLKVLRRLLRT